MRYKLFDLIEQVDERNSSEKYGISDVKGISIQKIFIETKAKMDGVNLKPYKLVKPNTFAYVTVTSRNGEKITWHTMILKTLILFHLLTLFLM